MADGITFALQAGGNNVIGNGGGDIGYGGLNAVGSVIQTWDNNRVGLNVDGDPFNTNSAPADLGAANLVTGSETVSYDVLSQILTMSGVLNVDGNVFNISDSKNIDLAAQFGGGIFYAGFTGGTGLSVADQRITDFSISVVPEPNTAALMLEGLGLLSVVARRKKKMA